MHNPAATDADTDVAAASSAELSPPVVQLACTTSLSVRRRFDEGEGIRADGCGSGPCKYSRNESAPAVNRTKLATRLRTHAAAVWQGLYLPGQHLDLLLQAAPGLTVSGRAQPGLLQRAA
jgi:hypothetical protein